MPRRKLWNVSDRLRHQPCRRLRNFLKNISLKAHICAASPPMSSTQSPQWVALIGL